MPFVKLDVPYRSQWDPDAKDHSADCGPTSLAMLLAALGDNISPDQLYRYIGQRGYSQYTSFGDLKIAAKARGLEMTRKNFLASTALQDLRTTLDAGKPFVALVNYAFWDHVAKNGFRGSHFILVVGYDDNNIMVHDPLYRGARREEGNYWTMPTKLFMDAWGGFAAGQNPNYAALISEKPVRRVGEAGAPAAQPTAQPAANFVLDETMRRRLLGKAAYDKKPKPDLNDRAILNAHLATLGTWGAAWDTHVVRRGDSLAKIAKIYYHDTDMWPVIVAFNEIPNPSMIEVGSELYIPRPQPTAADSGVVPLPGNGGPVG